VFRLTREVRFAVNSAPDQQLAAAPANSHAGYPSLTGFGQFFTARVTLRGELDPTSSYLVNIKEVDGVVREHLTDVLEMLHGANPSAAQLALLFARVCRERWPNQFESASLQLSPFLSIDVHQKEVPMVRLSQKFEFSASHRLFNRDLSDDDNRRVFGKCSNPHGHGHNYELQVTLLGSPDAADAVLKNLPDFERIVGSTVIERLDHKNLNVDVAEFADVIPSVENIARVIYKLLRPRFREAGATLAAVTVWETAKTWCEYSE
jgi:6-pyruvoyltetrahydropterin/6-carboxytetrahydropterin synthase